MEAFFDGYDARGDCNASLGPAMRKLLETDQEEPNFFGTMASSFTILLDRITRGRLAGDPPDLVEVMSVFGMQIERPAKPSVAKSA